MDNVVFMDDYDIFKTKNMQSLDEDYQDLIEICKFKIAELAEKFVHIIMEDAMMDSYNNAVRLKSLTTELLKKKSVDLLSALCNEDRKGWFHLLLIEHPSLEDKTIWENLLAGWRHLASSGPTDLEITEFVKEILQNKKLVNEVCKLIVYLTSPSI
jgi:hypothetical protein